MIDIMTLAKFSPAEDEIIRTLRPREASWKLMRPVTQIRERRDWLKKHGFEVTNYAPETKVTVDVGTVKALRRDGLSLTQIGERLGVSRQRVHQILRKDKASD
jgi:hypothetical protein